MSVWLHVLIPVFLGLAINECSDLSPWAARKAARLAARLAYPDPERSQLRAEEWEAVIIARPGKLLKLATALGFLLRSVGRRSRRIVLGGAAEAIRATCDALIRLAPPRDRGYVTIVELVLLRVATALGSRGARWRLAEVLEVIGRRDQALVVWYRAAEDERAARWFLAGKLRASGHHGDAIEVWRMAIESGDPGAWHELAMTSKIAGGLHAALRVWEEAIVAGEPMARHGLAETLELMGRVNEAVAIRVQSAEAGEPDAARALQRALDLHKRGFQREDPFGYVEGWALRNGRAPNSIDKVHDEDITDILMTVEYLDVADRQWRQLRGSRNNA